MPFTLAHPAIVIPFYRLFKERLSLTGLVIGSMVPDVEYCINTVTRSVISHTEKGIWIFDLPVAFFLTFCYHGFVKQALTNNLPGWIRYRLSPYSNQNWFHYFRKNFLNYFLCLLTGIVLHLLWDSVSHNTGYFVRRSAFLQENFIGTLTVSRFIWHISTAAGLYIVIRFFLSFPVSKVDTDSNKPDKNFWPLVFLVASVLTIIHWLPFVRPQEPRFILVAFSGAMMVGVIVVSFIFRFYKKQLS